MNNAQHESEQHMGMISQEGSATEPNPMEVIRSKIAASAELTPEEQEIARLDKKARYLTEGGRKEDVDVMVPLLLAKGYRPSVSEDGRRIEGLDWDEKEKDFEELDHFFDEVLRITKKESSKRTKGQTVFNGDAEFANICLNAYSKLSPEAANAFMEEYQLTLKPLESGSYSLLDEAGNFKSPHLRRMNDKNIPTSKAHNEPPALHTLRVGALLDTKILNETETEWVRVFAPTHDGKDVIANGDTHQFHAEFAYYRLREYLRSRKEQFRKLLPLHGTEKYDEAIEEVLLPVRYHHGAELLGRNVFTEAELKKLLKTASNFRVYSVLSMADAASVKLYRDFSAVNAAKSADIMNASIDMGEGDYTPEQVLFFCGYIARFAEMVHGLSAQVIHDIAEMPYFAKLKEIREDIPFEEKIRRTFLGKESQAVQKLSGGTEPAGAD